jgi:predicted permease
MIGGLLGVLAAGWSRASLAREIVGSSRLLPPGFSLDTRTMIFAAVVSIATAMIFGLVPAVRAARAGRLGAIGLNERHAIGLGSTRGMRPLVVLQLAVSVVIIFAATLLSRTVMNLARVEPGFGVEHLVSASFNPRTRAQTSEELTAVTDRLVGAAAAVPGTTSAAVSVCGLLWGCSYTTNVRIEGVEGSVSVYQNWVGPRYLATIGLPLVRGREFDGHDTEQRAPVAIISDSIARRYFPGQDPLGRRLSGGVGDTDPFDAEIIGVARDLHPVSLREPPVQMVFYPLNRRRADAIPTALDLRVSGDPDQSVAAVRDALRGAEPGLTINVTSMPARLNQQVERERAVAYLTSAFAGLALLLASVGLYGLLSYGVAQRSREIGVRMALGAQGSEVLALVLRQGGVLAIVGLTLGLLSAPLATRSLQGMFFDVTPLDPPTFVGVTVILLAVAAVAAIIPARRATKVDPVVALRCE